MATASADYGEPTCYECTVCAESLTCPKILKCGHLLCRNCIVRWLQTKVTAGCPLCRSMIVNEKERRGRKVEEMVDGFPTDLAMAALVEAEEVLSKQHVCLVCVDVAAVALCLQCGDMFCLHCSELHLKQTATKHHDVRDLNSLTTETLASHRPATCAEHKDQVCLMYCPSHNISICELCATTRHRQCPRLVSLQTKVAQSAAELAQLTAKLCDGQERMDANVRLLDKHVEELKSQAQTAVDLMENVRKHLKAIVDARFQKVKDMIDKVVAEETKVTKEVRSDTVEKRSKVTAQLVMNERYGTFEEHENFHDMVSLAKSRARELDLDSNIPKTVKVNHKLTLNVKFLEVVRFEQELSQLGLVTFSPVSRDTAESAKPHTSAKNSDVTTQASAANFQVRPNTLAANFQVRPNTSAANFQVRPNTLAANFQVRPNTSAANFPVRPNTLAANFQVRPNTSAANFQIRPNTLAANFPVRPNTSAANSNVITHVSAANSVVTTHVSAANSNVTTHVSAANSAVTTQASAANSDVTTQASAANSDVTTQALAANSDVTTQVSAANNDVRPNTPAENSDVRPNTPAANSDVTTQASAANSNARTQTSTPVFRFHDNHGPAVTLDANRQTARRAFRGWHHGVVISRDPMMVNWLYQVRIDEVTDSRFGSMQLGVLTTNPDQYSVPPNIFASGPDAVCLSSEGLIMKFFQRISDDRLEHLRLITAGSDVGLALDSNRSLHLLACGAYFGVVATDIPDPCYFFFFDLYDHCRQVTALPPVEIEP